VAADIITLFAGDSVEPDEIRRMAREAYTTFHSRSVTPLKQVDRNLYVLELFHGPTLAFKDLAMQLLGRLMDYALEKRRERTTIVVATSGDTGGAAVEAFRNRSNVDLVVLFPEGRVSDVQQRMMTTADSENVHALAIKGSFDDCQALVKSMFNHPTFRKEVNLSAVNSINFVRIIAQVVYYFVSGVALGAPDRKLSFAIPTGNFGNAYSGYVASRMGLPIERLIVATNVNDILVRAINDGVYEPHEAVPTISPSMDIQVSSNFERLVFEAYDRDAERVRQAMASLAQSRRFDISGPALSCIHRYFAAGSATEMETALAIRNTRERVGLFGREDPGYLIDPHTAVAMTVAYKLLGEMSSPTVVLSTAHPAKFPDAVKEACGVRPELPEWLSGLNEKREQFETLPSDQSTVQEYIRSHTRAVKVAA
jgi:threonine synthase